MATIKEETPVKEETMEVKSDDAAQGVKRPVDGVENEDEPPSKVPKANPNSFKNVFKQLSLMRPGLFFEMEATEGEAEGPQTFTMVVDVDGVKFRGTGPSKRNAKVVAAEQVLTHLESLGVKPRELTEAELKPKQEPKPKPEAPPASQPMSEEQKALQMSGKNPVMMLHEIRPNFECAIESDERKGAHRKVVMSVTVEGQKFVGSGRSNKNARARAAVSALESLFGLSFTEFGENEIPVFLGDEWAWRKFTKRAEKVVQPVAAPGKAIKNAVMQLNDMYKGLEFNVVDRSGPDHCPFFKVSVDIEGQTFEGSGTTKKAAKLDAAEKALDGLALSGVLAQRATQKKQHQWGKQQNNKGGQLGQTFVAEGAEGAQGENGSGNTEQNGQSLPRGRGRGRGRGQGRGGPRGGFRGRGMRGGPRGGGGFRGRGGGSAGNTPSVGGWGSGDVMMRGRGGRGGRGARGGGAGGTAGSVQQQTGSNWLQSAQAPTDTTDYSYQDPYNTSSTDTSNTWSTNDQSSYMYGGDNSYIADNTSYGGDTSSYGANTYNKASYDTSYDNSYNQNSFQADANTWSDYGYGY